MFESTTEFAVCLSVSLSHTNTHTLQGVSYCTDSPVSRPPPVSLTNSGRSVRSVTEADKPARRPKPWRETDATQHVATNCLHLSCEYKHLLVFWPRGDDKQLAHICVRLSDCPSLLTSPYLPHILHLPSYPPTASSAALKWQISLLIVQETSVLFLVSSTHSRAPVSDPDPRLMKNKNEWINNSLAWGGGMLSVRREPNALPVSWDGSAHVSPLSFSANKHYLTLHTHLLRWALIISGNPPHEPGCCFPPFCLPLRPSSSYTQRIMSVVKPKVLTGWHSAPVLSVSLRAADHSFLKSSLVRVCWEGVWRRWVKMSWCWK